MEVCPFFHKNKDLPKQAKDLVHNLFAQKETVLFVIVGDMNLAGNYADTAMVFTPTYCVRCDGTPGDEKRYAYADLTDVRSTRMYSNAALSAQLSDGNQEILFRFTGSLAALGDGAALFINRINEGDDPLEANAVMSVTFERALSVCPKCGRTLLHPGAECIMCRSKFKVLERLSQYIKPQTKPLLFSILLSFVTTFLALVPPTVTGFIVDVVFNGGESDVGALNAIAAITPEPRTLLTVLVLLLFGVHLLNCIVGIARSYLMRMVGDKAVTALRNDIYRKAQR